VPDTGTAPDITGIDGVIAGGAAGSGPAVARAAAADASNAGGVVDVASAVGVSGLRWGAGPLPARAASAAGGAAIGSTGAGAVAGSAGHDRLGGRDDDVAVPGF
jgi:hypothetical protein